MAGEGAASQYLPGSITMMIAGELRPLYGARRTKEGVAVNYSRAKMEPAQRLGKGRFQPGAEKGWNRQL
jgi:hypothetical protein